MTHQAWLLVLLAWRKTSQRPGRTTRLRSLLVRFFRVCFLFQVTHHNPQPYIHHSTTPHLIPPTHLPAIDLRQLVDTANAPIFGIDAEGKVNEWNNKTAEITGFRKDETFGLPLVSTFIKKQLQKSVETGESNSVFACLEEQKMRTRATTKPTYLFSTQFVSVWFIPFARRSDEERFEWLGNSELRA